MNYIQHDFKEKEHYFEVRTRELTEPTTPVIAQNAGPRSVKFVLGLVFMAVSSVASYYTSFRSSY